MTGIILCGLLISLGWQSGDARAQDAIAAQIQRTNTPPTIDGVGNDAVWAQATTHGNDEFFLAVNSDPDDEADLSIAWKALWDDANLYVLINVTDDEIVPDDSCSWEDDSVEVYIDAQNLDEPDYRPGSNLPPPDGIPAYQLTAIAGDPTGCGRYPDPPDHTSAFSWGINSYDNGGDPDSTQYPEESDTSATVVIDPTHYSFEAAFPWTALEETPANIQARGEMGFGIAVNDDDDLGGRDTQMMWATPAGDLWMRSDTFPSVALSNETVSGGGQVKPPLRAGDADQDLDFDQLDLVRVQIAAKYLTGRAASWGEGDWNGAPGGQQGNPPAGNGFFDQLDIIAALAPGHYLTGPYAALANANGARGDGQTSIIYNAGTGEVAVDAPAGTNLTSVNIDSAGRIFTGAPAQNLGGSFDNDSDNNIFKATFGSSFGSLSFGNVAQAGLSQQFVLNDLTVVGSLAGGGALGNVDLIYIPEPSTIVLALLGVLAVFTGRRMWSR
jgi:hypothetical protein